jgi:hypothetical protein
MMRVSYEPVDLLLIFHYWAEASFRLQARVNCHFSVLLIECDEIKEDLSPYVVTDRSGDKHVVW